MTEPPIADDAAVLLGEDDDPTFLSDFAAEQMFTDDPVLSVTFTTGRDWESKEGDDGGMTVRTKPDPMLQVFDPGVAYILTLSVPAPDPMVWRAYEIPDADPRLVAAALVPSLDRGHEGIESVANIEADDDFEGAARTIEHIVDGLKTVVEAVE